MDEAEYRARLRCNAAMGWTRWFGPSGPGGSTPIGPVPESLTGEAEVAYISDLLVGCEPATGSPVWTYREKLAQEKHEKSPRQPPWLWQHPTTLLGVPIAAAIVVAFLPELQLIFQVGSWVVAFVLIVIWLHCATPLRLRPRIERVGGTVLLVIIFVIGGAVLAYRSSRQNPVSQLLVYIDGLPNDAATKVTFKNETGSFMPHFCFWIMPALRGDTEYTASSLSVPPVGINDLDLEAGASYPVDISPFIQAERPRLPSPHPAVNGIAVYAAYTNLLGQVVSDTKMFAAGHLPGGGYIDAKTEQLTALDRSFLHAMKEVGPKMCP